MRSTRNLEIFNEEKNVPHKTQEDEIVDFLDLSFILFFWKFPSQTLFYKIFFHSTTYVLVALRFI